MNYTGCYIELTSRCNLSCKHCLHTKEGEDYHLSLESVKKAITYFIRNGLKCVYLSGGEPLLYNQFSDICDYLTLQESKRPSHETQPRRIPLFRYPAAVFRDSLSYFCLCPFFRSALYD